MSPKSLLGVVAGTLVAVGALVALAPKPGINPSPSPVPIAWAPVYQLSGVHLTAGSCAATPGCTADVWGTLPDGGQIRLQLRAVADGGGMVDILSDAGFALILDAGVGGLQ